MSGRGRRLLVGQLPIWTLGMAVAWLAVGAVLLAVMGWGGGAPVTVGIIAATFVIGLALAVMGLRMVVRLDGERVRVLGRASIPLGDIDAVSVARTPGRLPIFVPVIDLRRGRALDRFEIDGLSSIGSAKPALRWAQVLADAAGTGLVNQESTGGGHQGPRRGV